MLKNPILQGYISGLERDMRQYVARHLPDSIPGFGVMAKYALGWVDENGKALEGISGKRIRPLIVLLCTEAVGGTWQKAMPAAAAVEFLHNFSLIHDDIQDNSPMRHKRPSVWKVWGIANAINAGDALFGLSHIALHDITSTGVKPDLAYHLLGVFNRTVIELTRGQHLDMRFEKEAIVSVDDYLSMIKGKTAALLATCAELGATIGSGDPDLGERYAEMGLNLGIAFQIRDDILGIWGDANVMGKSADSDIASKKKSLPILYGLSQSPELVELFQKPELNEADIAHATHLLDAVQARAYAQEIESQAYSKVARMLSVVGPEHQSGKLLESLMKYLLGRQD